MHRQICRIARIGNFGYRKLMEQLFVKLSPIAVLLVLLVLIAGLWNMMRGNNANLSQTLMRWRVGLQFVALCILMAAMYFKRS